MVVPVETDADINVGLGVIRYPDNVKAVNGETVSSEYLGVYSSSINWSSNDSAAVSVTDGYIEAKGQAAASVVVSAISSDDSGVSDSIEYAAVELDITVEGERTYGNKKDIAGTWLTSPPARPLSLWSSNSTLTSDNFTSNGFAGRWAIDENWTAGVEPGNGIEVNVGSGIYLKLTDCTDFTANAYRRSLDREPTICNVISWNGKVVATVHFKAGNVINT